MSLLIVLLFALNNLQAQVENFYGNYLIAVPGEENEITLEQNCWTMEIDEVILGPADYEDYEIELNFNSFHSINLMGKVLESSANGMRIEVRDPDMEEAEYEIYKFISHSDGRFMLVNESVEIEHILIRVSDRDKYTYISCPEESPEEPIEDQE